MFSQKNYDDLHMTTIVGIIKADSREILSLQIFRFIR